MTPREEFLETLLFGSPDRIPFSPGGPRQSTLKRWHAEGLPMDRGYMEVLLDDVNAERRRRGLDPADWKPRQPVVDHGVSFRMIPAFEEKVISHENGHYIVQDWMGAITEISDEYDYTYIRDAIDFVTRKWHRFPVECRDDFEEHIRWRFNPCHRDRFPADFDARCDLLRERDYPMILHFNGPFWQLREFCGMEGLCMLMLTDPMLVKDMMTCWMEFVSRTMAPILEKVTPDMIHFSEDMCYKAHPMISPEMTEQYCAPCYRRWVSEARAAGVRLFSIDSDGDVTLLLPLWRECGINCIDPIEAAAGNDISAFRERYGHEMAFRGGVDKRAIAAGGDILRAELARLEPVIRDGGFIPSCDHGVPHDISWPRFREYALQLAELTGWLA